MKEPKIITVFNDTENDVKIKMPRQIGQHIVSDKESVITIKIYPKKSEKITKDELIMKWCNEYDLLVSDINYQKDKIKRGKVQQLHLCIQDLKKLNN